MRSCLPVTPLGMGYLFPFVDPDAELAVTMANRAMTAAEWDQYTRSPQSMRKRRARSRVEELEAELRTDTREYGGAR